MIQQVTNYFKLKKMQYELVTGLGMLQTWEKLIICKWYTWQLKSGFRNKPNEKSVWSDRFFEIIIFQRNN